MRPPRSTRTDTLFPYTTRFRSRIVAAAGIKPNAGNFCAIGLERGTMARLHPQNLAVKGDRFVHARAAERHMVQSKRRHFFFQSGAARCRSEEHTSELQSLMRISYAVFCLTKKITRNDRHK